MTPATLLYKLLAVLRIVIDVIFQKILTCRVPNLTRVGSPLSGQVALVTGCTNGIGKHTAIELGRRGAKVILACRDVAAGGRVAQEVEAAQKAAGHPSHAVVQHLDLSDLKSVKDCASRITASQGPLHILVNNAGVYDMSGRKRRTSDGFEQHMGVNHLGHFALTMHLLPLLRKSAKDFPTGARIVNVSSMIHILSRLIASDLHSRKSYSATTAYANSKCAQIMFTRVLRVMLADEAVHVFAVHPGMVLTEISRDIPAFIYRLQRVIMPLFLFTSAQGARASVYCATSTEAVHKGHLSEGYISSSLEPESPDPVACDPRMSAHIWRFSASETHLPPELDILDIDKAMAGLSKENVQKSCKL